MTGTAALTLLAACTRATPHRAAPAPSPSPVAATGASIRVTTEQARAYASCTPEGLTLTALGEVAPATGDATEAWSLTNANGYTCHLEVSGVGLLDAQGHAIYADVGPDDGYGVLDQVAGEVVLPPGASTRFALAQVPCGHDSKDLAERLSVSFDGPERLSASARDGQPTGDLGPCSDTELTGIQESSMVVTGEPLGAVAPPHLEPRDVTFISPDDGWVIGLGACQATPCAAVERTTDRGRTWTRLSRLPVDADELRFADAQHGYAWGARGDASLFATDDGGRTWGRVPIDSHRDRGFTPVDVQQVEVADGTVWVLGTWQGQASYPGLYRAAVGSRTFTLVGGSPNRGGELVVHGPTAYVLGTAGAGPVTPSLVASDDVTRPDLPDQSPSGGRQVEDLAASTDGSLTLLAEPFNSDARQPALWDSHDGGFTWAQRALAPPEDGGRITTARGRTLFIGGAVWLDEGAGWRKVLSFRDKYAYQTYVAFTDDTHALALERDVALHLSSDGGRTWTTARF